MKPVSGLVTLLAALLVIVGCGGGGSGDSLQSQAPGVSSPLSAPWFDPATNIVLNGGFEDVDLSTYIPDHWDVNIYFRLPPDWPSEDPGGVVARGGPWPFAGDDGVYPPEGDGRMAVVSGGMHRASISQELQMPDPIPSPPIFNISFWFNMYAWHNGEGHPTFPGKFQAWLYEYDSQTENYFLLFEAAYKDMEKESGTWGQGSGSIRGWRFFSTSRRLDCNKNYALFFQMLTNFDTYNVRVTGFLDDVMVVPIPKPPGKSDG